MSSQIVKARTALTEFGKNKRVQKLVNLGFRVKDGSINAGKTFWYYAKVELRPPSPIAVSQGVGELLAAARAGRYKTVTVKEAFVNTLCVSEIFAWFVIGEVIAKGQIVGLPVPNSSDWTIKM